MDDRIIDAIIFGTNCMKAQDKLLQMPKTLTLQQCLSVVRHYESLKLHIQQISPDTRSVDYLRLHHSSKKKGSGQGTQSSSFNANNQRGCSQSQSRQGQSQSNQKMSSLAKTQCYGCGQDHHEDKSECPTFGKTCHKCSRSNHFVNVCGRIPYRRPFRSKLQGRQTLVNELNQNNCDSGASFDVNFQQL